MTLLYTAEHEWIDATDPTAAIVGITVHAQDALGDVVFVELPEVGATFAQGDVAVEELLHYVAERVASYKRVRSVEVVDAIPKSPSGKILRRVLRDRALREAR